MASSHDGFWPLAHQRLADYVAVHESAFGRLC
jgi:hypothetical protein